MDKNKTLIVVAFFIIIVCTIGVVIPMIFNNYNAVGISSTEIDTHVDKPLPVKGSKEIVKFVPVIEDKDDNEVVKKEDNSSSSVDSELNKTTSSKESQFPEQVLDNDKDISNKDTDLDSLANTPITEETVQQLIEENKDFIEEEDLNVGNEIYEKLDTEYIFSFTNEGLTEDEKIIIKEYLHEVLTEEEYTIVMNLFGKYIGLVQ